jgi:hypothetical protein
VSLRLEKASLNATKNPNKIGQFRITLSPKGKEEQPFDSIGDYMRGTRGLMLDMCRHPGKPLW